MGIGCAKMCNGNAVAKPKSTLSSARKAFLEESLEEHKLSDPSALFHSKALKAKSSPSIAAFDARAFFAERRTKILAFNGGSVRKVFLGEANGVRELLYILRKSDFGDAPRARIATLKSLSESADPFGGDWEAFEDCEHFYISERFPVDSVFLLGALRDGALPKSAALAEFDRRVREFGKYKNVGDALLLLQPAHLTINAAKELRVNAPLSLCAMCDARKCFAALPFTPPEQIASATLCEQSFFFVFAALSAFLLYDCLIYDCSRYERLLDEEYTLGATTAESFGADAPFFRAALEYYPAHRKFICGRLSRAGDAARPRTAHSVLALLHSFSLFAAEFAAALARAKRVRAALAEHALGLSAHELTLEKVYEELGREFDLFGLETQDEVRKALRRSRKSGETHSVEQFLASLWEEQTVRLALSYEIYNRELAAQPSLNLKSYLECYEELSDGEKEEIVSRFLATLNGSATPSNTNDNKI